MVDLLEKKLGDLVRELESQRDALRRDLDKVNAQLELLSGLFKGKSSTASTGSSSTSKSSPAPTKAKRGRGRPPKSASTAPSSSTSSTSTKSSGKKKRGRPPKSASKAGSTTSKSKGGAATKGKSKSNGGGTLRDELLTIAKANNGMFSIREASKALVKSGRYDTAERAAANIHAAIKYYTSNFSKEGSQRGVYRAKA
jgi:hypothetical protein